MSGSTELVERLSRTLAGCLGRRKRGFCLNDLAQPSILALDGVGRVDELANLSRIVKEGG